MRNNKYDFFLFIQVAVLCMGNIGGAFQVSRIIAIILFPQLLIDIGKTNYKYAKFFMNVFLMFYLYILLSFFWTPDREAAVKQLVYYPVHFMLFLELIVFSKNATHPLKSISRGWLVSVLLCSAVAYWEITTGNHLDIAYQHDDTFYTGTEILQHMSASVTFFNYNSYVTFLCFSFPWIFFILLDKNRSFIEKSISFLALVATVLTIVINASRGGVLTVAVMLFIYILFSKKFQWESIMLILGIIAVGYYMVNSGDFVTAVLAARLSNEGMGAEESRFYIWSNVLSMFANTGGFGVGVGGLHAAMRQNTYSSITASHNMFLEILSQYGVVITITIFLFFCNLLKQSFSKERNRKIVLLMTLLTIPIYTIIDSVYLVSAHLYAHIATIYVFSNYELIRHSNPILRNIA